VKADAYAKINLALLVGQRRADGLHEVTSVMQRIGLADTIELEEATRLRIEGFPEDTLVRRALSRLAEAVGVEPRWWVHIEKRIPVAAGLGGGSADAAAALMLANETLSTRLGPDRLHEICARLGADVPFFLEPGPKLAEGAGERLRPIELPQDYSVVLALAHGARKSATASIYETFRQGEGFARRRTALLAALEAGDIVAFPPNDLVRDSLADELRSLGAFHAGVTGAGPAVFGLFRDEEAARAAARRLTRADVWVTNPVW
jgi:4-diphosphocytidyl-2-C-methyl-D-erythritol kinase